MASDQISHKTLLFDGHFTDLDRIIHFPRGRSLFLLLIFFSLLILIATLFLYAHWVCRYRRHVSTSAPPQVRPPVGLDPEAIKKLPISLWPSANHKAAGVEEVECCICLGAFQDEEKVKALPECKHAYHSDCLDKWLSAQSSCPLCRASLRLDSLQELVVV